MFTFQDLRIFTFRFRRFHHIHNYSNLTIVFTFIFTTFHQRTILTFKSCAQLLGLCTTSYSLLPSHPSSNAHLSIKSLFLTKRIKYVVTFTESCHFLEQLFSDNSCFGVHASQKGRWQSENWSASIFSVFLEEMENNKVIWEMCFHWKTLH